MSDESASADAPDERWYSDGLRFECTGCGNCCSGSPGYVWVDDEELAAIADFTGKSIGELRLFDTRIARGRLSLKEYANGDCIYLDPESRRCSIYPVRPKQCRTWPFWHSNIASPEAWQDVQRECPGAGHGPLVSLEEIERTADVISM